MLTNIAVLTAVTDLDSFDKRRRTRKMLLAGDPVFVSMNAQIPQAFIQLAPREASGGLLSQFSKNAPKVYMAVDERLIGLPKFRFALALDGYLSWGLRERRKTPTILFGGGESATGVNVVIMIFASGRLIGLHEKSLPSRDAAYFGDALHEMISELRIAHPTARLIQSAPLIDWQAEGVEYIGDRPLRGLSYRPLYKHETRRSTFMLPAAVAGLGIAAYSLAMVSGWHKYSSAIDEHKAAISDPEIKAKGGIDTGFLTMMNARRMYMEQPRRQTLLADKSAEIVRGIADVPDVRVLEMKLPAPSLTPQLQIGISANPNAAQARNRISVNRSPDVWLSIEVPKSPEAAIVQAKVVMTQIAHSTGMSLRLAHQGWRDSQSLRIFNIEGFIHD